MWLERGKREFPEEWETALIQPFIRRREVRESLGTIEGFHCYQLWEKYIQKL